MVVSGTRVYPDPDISQPGPLHTRNVCMSETRMLKGSKAHFAQAGPLREARLAYVAASLRAALDGGVSKLRPRAAKVSIL